MTADELLGQYSAWVGENGYFHGTVTLASFVADVLLPREIDRAVYRSKEPLPLPCGGCGKCLDCLLIERVERL